MRFMKDNTAQKIDLNCILAPEKSDDGGLSSLLRTNFASGRLH